MALQRRGFEILEAKNGAEAVELCRVYSFDCILMDIEMPVMNGIEATRRMLQINPKAVIIGVTAHEARKDALLLAGAKEVLIKPFSIKDLISTVEKYTGAKIAELKR
jgi:CheY-like chemotaxis protein